MLAVQQAPVMASDRSPDPFLPFGYSVDPNQEPPMDPPPEPPSGPSLLSEHDNKFLSSFFDDITADQYNMPSFGEGLNFSDTWLDLPPQFMGTATSFGGQQAGQSMASPSALGMPNDTMSFHGTASQQQMMPPPPHPQQQIPHPQQQHHHHHQLPHHTHQMQPQQHPHPHSDEVLNAAATLLNNNQPHPHTPTQNDRGPPQRPMGPPVGHLRHQGLEEFQEDGRRSLAPAIKHESAFNNDWMIRSPGQGVCRNGSSLPTDFQWGSDSNFSMSQRYTPDANRETVESMHRDQMKLLDSLEVNKSAASTRPSSPSQAQNQQAANHLRQQGSQARMTEEAGAPPRKRRKSKANREDGDNEEDEPASAKGSGRRKSKVKKEEDSPSNDAGKKRKGALNGSAKAARENLSEEQKRENHIRSEQKRRTLIKEGFDDLCELVPALRSGGYSKSTMLNLAATWLEELLADNESLEKQLADLGGKS